MIRDNLRYQVCNRCIMDNTANDIVFDENGNCNFCNDFKKLNFNEEDKKKKLDQLIFRIRSAQKNKDYNCIVGLSGGVDSCYVLVRAVELGLKPLAVHMDNGWNSELAQNNISNLVKSLNVDLYTHVIDWEEYKNLQKAFFKANVVDIELLYDNAMMAANFQIANKFKIKYILSGMNTSTEGFKIPNEWSWFKNDAKNIKQIAKKFSNQKIKTFPLFGTFDYIKFVFMMNIKWISFPDYFNYHKEKAINELETKFNFKRYPYKHYENIFTRFYQGYILPKKFDIDKRKLHFSNLILTGQISRSDALKKIQEPPYIDIDEERKDIEYFLKKMNWEKKQLENYLKADKVSHIKYGSEKILWKFLTKIYSKLNFIIKIQK